ncbi:hypothetical protein [Nannocystis pusilla]|uniref:hypothetical protein n=1 Tax=Nannocystis pusilla TaxID=889268 RepID=UPI003BF31578
MIAKLSPLPLVALLGLFACKEDGATAHSTISDLPANKKVSELSTAEQEQLCEATATYSAHEIEADEIRRAVCSLQGIVLSSTLHDGSVDACITARDECLAAPEKPAHVESDERTCAIDWSTCKTTVGELDACIEEVVTELKSFYMELDCGNIGKYKDEMPSKEPEPGEACRRVQTKCPGFVPGDLVSNPKEAPTS